MHAQRKRQWFNQFRVNRMLCFRKRDRKRFRLILAKWRLQVNGYREGAHRGNRQVERGHSSQKSFEDAIRRVVNQLVSSLNTMDHVYLCFSRRCNRSIWSSACGLLLCESGSRPRSFSRTRPRRQADNQRKWSERATTEWCSPQYDYSNVGADERARGRFQRRSRKKMQYLSM